MPGRDQNPRARGSEDPRAGALADYLRRRADEFSMSAEVTALDSTARAGMALLDAAAIADAMLADDPRIRSLSEAGRFESMPRGRARFIETPAIRSAVRRPLVAEQQSGVEIIAGLVAAATAREDPAREDPADQERWF